MSLKLVSISDTHSYHRKVEIPDADIIVCAGDISFKGELDIIADFADWFGKLPIKYKICIFGNHEVGIQNGPKRNPAINLIKDAGIIYLENSSVNIEGLKIYGSPASPLFHFWEWNYQRGKDIEAVWSEIPNDTDILITHGPPYGILDYIENKTYNIGRDLHQGCQDLLNRVNQLKNLKAHIFGHLHLNGGQTLIKNGVQFVNAAICTERYHPDNLPIVIEI